MLGALYKPAVLKVAFGTNHSPDFPSIYYLQIYDASGPPTANGGGIPWGLTRTAVPNTDAWWEIDEVNGQAVNPQAIWTAVASSTYSNGRWFALHAHPTNDTLVFAGRLLYVISLEAGKRRVWQAGNFRVPVR